MICCIPKLLWHLCRRDEGWTPDPRLMSRCQVRVSLCCLHIVHILSSALAGSDCGGRGGGGIWVSQNLTTERGTSWGPAEENEACYERARGTFWLYIQASYVCWRCSWFTSQLCNHFLNLSSHSWLLRFGVKDKKWAESCWVESCWLLLLIRTMLIFIKVQDGSVHFILLICLLYIFVYYYIF